MNEHVIVNQAKFFPSNYTNQVVHLFTALSRSIVNIQIYIFGHVLTVNSRCYGCCYVNNLYHCVHSPEINSATLFQNDFQFLVFQGSQILYFQKLEVFHEHRHIFWKVAPQILIMLRRSERSERAAANMPGLHCLQKNQNALRYECDDNSLSLFLSK